MSPRLVAVLLSGLALCGPMALRAQPPDVRPIEAADEVRQQLQTCREGILDPNSRPDERRRWVELLFSYETPQSDALIAELLSSSNRADVQIAVCRGIEQRGRRGSYSPDECFVEPLLSLLGAEAEELRSAAAAALAEMSDPSVAEHLRTLAAKPDAPMVKRMAAVDALAPNTHRREVVEKLIGLLELGVPEVTDRVFTALEPIAAKSLPRDAKLWRTWWLEQSQADEPAWLARQLRLYRERARRLSVEFRDGEAQEERVRAAVTARIRDFQRELFRALGPEQRDAKLVEWIEDPLPVVKLAALGVVAGRISDEGKRPDGEVLNALLRLLKHDAPAVRREALRILQNLSDPAVLEAVLSRLNEEKDPAVRHALFQACGRLGQIAAIPALLREVSSAGSSAESVREASLALGQLTAKPEAAESLRAASTTLLDRLRSLTDDQPSVRAALLSAMAGVGDPRFAPEFVNAVESAEVDVLQAGLRGLRATQETSKMPRCRALMAHADPRVRLAAIEVVSTLGREDADVEALLARVHPAVESNDLAREAAWRGVRSLFANRSFAERLRAVDRLRETPDLAMKYLEELATALSATSNNPVELDAVRDRLATMLLAAGKDAEAVPHLRELFAGRSTRGDPSSNTVGLRWLEAVLHSPSPSGVADVVTKLVQSSGDTSMKDEVLRAVGQYLEAPTAGADPDRARRLLAELRAVPSDVVGDGWVAAVQRFAAQLENTEGKPGNAASP